LHRQKQGQDQDVSVTISFHGSNESGGKSVVTATTVAKDISFWGGLCLLICNTTGPGVVTLPLVAQSAGWVPTAIGFTLVGVLSYLSSMFICEAMTEVPGNERYQANVSFSISG
jgi:amino acid permease